MKILFFTRRFYPEIGGVETHVLEVSKRLVAMGHEVTVVTERRAGSQQSLGDTSEGNSVWPTVLHIPVGTNEKNKKFTVWKWLWEHRELMKSMDVIHAHDVFYWYIPFRLLFPRTNAYTTFHGYETVYPVRPNAIKMRRLSEKLSRGNICVGDFISKWYGTHPSFVTYGGVSPLAISHSLFAKSNRLKILFVGRMEEDTGVEMYAELLEMLKKNKVEYTFVGLGDGNLRERLGEYGETPGLVSDVPSYIHGADVVFASSYLSILDALAAGKLVISLYDNPLKKDYLEMTPFAKWIVAESSIASAYKKIKYYILNPNRLKQVITEEKVWAEKQTWDEVTKIYLKLWKK